MAAVPRLESSGPVDQAMTDKSALAGLSSPDQLEHLVNLPILRATLGITESRALGADTPLLLHIPEQALLVAKGFVDLFAVSLDGLEPIGRRHFLTRINAGGLLLGLPTCHTAATSTAMPNSRHGFGETYGILAVGSLGAQALSIPHRDCLNALPTTTLAVLIDFWGSSLSDAFAASVSIWPELIAPEDGQCTLAPGQRLYGNGRRLSWLSADADILRLVDDPNTLGAGPLPVMGKTWLSSISHATLTACHTAALIEQGGHWSALDNFHRMALGRIVENLIESDRLLCQRTQARTNDAQAALSAGLANLASVIRGTPVGLERICGNQDPLFLACRRVGQALGVVVTAPLPEAYPQADELSRILRASRLKSRRVILRNRWWRKDNGPLLGFREDDSPVALLPAPGGYVLEDGRDGSRVRVDTRLALSLKGEGYQLYRALPERILRPLELFQVGLRGLAGDLRLIVLMGLIGGLLTLATPVVSGLLVAHIIPRAAVDQLWQVIFALVAVALAATGFQLTRGLALLRLQGHLDWHLQAALFDRLLRLPVTFFRRFSTGELVDRTLGIQAIRETLSAHATNALLGGLFGLYGLILLFFYDVKLAVIAVALVLFAGIVTFGLGLLQVREERRQIRHRGEVEGLVMQLLAGVAKLKVAAAEPRALSTWADAYASQKRRFVSAQRVANWQEVFQAVFPLLATAQIFLAISAGLQPVDPGLTPPTSFTIGDFIAFNAAFGQLLVAMNQMVLALTAVLAVVPLFERLQPLLETPTEYGANMLAPGTLKGEIELSEVSFRYLADGPLILDRLSLHIDAGEFVAVVGASGSGKSTILRLLLGFEQALQGGIFYDGKPIETLDLSAVRQQIGIVMQNGRLMTGSLLENIVGSSHLAIEDAWHAARLAGLAEDIKAMPMGMHTVLTEGGSTLSGGQRQRLMIARALVHQPRILLLDEASSALDNRTQAIVAETFARLNTTRLIIAHRLSTIRQVDRICVIEHGRIVQSGSFEALMAEEDGPFYALARRQLL